MNQKTPDEGSLVPYIRSYHQIKILMCCNYMQSIRISTFYSVKDLLCTISFDFIAFFEPTLQNSPLLVKSGESPSLRKQFF